MNEETAPIYIVTTDAEAEQLANDRIRPTLPPTPETDAARVSVDTYAGEYLVDADPRGRWVEATFAEKLERERDEARLQRDQARREAEASQDCKWPKYQFSWWQKDCD